jgi:hypothetical protein
MGMLQDVVDGANTKATNQGDNPLAGKFFLSETIEKEDLNWDSLPKASIHIGAIDASVDQDDSSIGCLQSMEVQIKCWVICAIEDVFELIKQANRAILGLQPDQYITELILQSGYLKEINGNKCWYELSYQFKNQTKSE